MSTELRGGKVTWHGQYLPPPEVERQGGSDYAQPAFFGSDSRTVIFLAPDGATHIVDVLSGELKQLRACEEGTKSAILFSNAGIVAASCADNSVHLWDARSLKMISAPLPDIAITPFMTSDIAEHNFLFASNNAQLSDRLERLEFRLHDSDPESHEREMSALREQFATTGGKVSLYNLAERNLRDVWQVPGFNLLAASLNSTQAVTVHANGAVVVRTYGKDTRIFNLGFQTTAAAIQLDPIRVVFLAATGVYAMKIDGDHPDIEKLPAASRFPNIDFSANAQFIAWTNQGSAAMWPLGDARPSSPKPQTNMRSANRALFTSDGALAIQLKDVVELRHLLFGGENLILSAIARVLEPLSSEQRKQFAISGSEGLIPFPISVGKKREGDFLSALGNPAPKACDLVAGHPEDSKGRGKGIDFEQIPTDDAIKVCKAARDLDPADLRTRYQLGRAHLKQFQDSLDEKEEGVSGSQKDGRDKTMNDYPDLAAAYQLFESAAEQGYPAAQVAFADLLDRKEYAQLVPHDGSRATQLREKAAGSRNIRAQIDLAKMIMGDEYAADSVRKALPFLLDAAAQGSFRAFSILETLNIEGRLPNSTPSDAFYWALLAVRAKQQSTSTSFSWNKFDLIRLARSIDPQSAARQIKRYLKTIAGNEMDASCFSDAAGCVERFDSKPMRLGAILGEQ
jgi:TPR repeat protein